MVHSPLPTDLYSSYPVVHNPQSIYHLDNMSSKSPCNGTDNKISKKRKQEYQHPITSVNDYYLPNQQQKAAQLLYQQNHQQQLVNVAYQHQQQITNAMLTQTDWSEFVRSNPSTPTSSPPPPNTDATSNNCSSSYNNGMNLHDYLMTENLAGNLDGSFGLEALYNSYAIGTTIPMTTTSDFSAAAATANFAYDDVNTCNNENVSRKNSVDEIQYDNLGQLAAAALLVDSRNDKSTERITYDENVRHNRNRPPHLMPLNITSATTQSNVYRLGEIPADFGFAESIASSPSPAVTMPPTPVFFEPEFLDGVTNNIPEGYTFGINPSLTSEQLLENNSISVSRSHSFDSISSSSQQSNVFTSEKIIENPQTITPTAITINQPYTTQQNFAPMLSQTSSALDMETDYFNSKQHRKQQHHHHHHHHDETHSNSCNTVRRTRSRTLSNPPNIKAEPRTPALSPPESPGASVSSGSSSPPSPSPPQTPNYIRRMSISPTIIEEEEEILGSNSNTNSNPVPLVASSYVPDMHHSLNSTANPRITQSTAVNIMRPIIQQYLNSSNPAALGEKTVMVLTSKVAQKSYGTEKRFLCPPPTTLILGSNWWCPSPHNVGHSPSSTTFSPPKISVGISGEQGHQQGILEWISPSGNPLDPASSCSEMAFSGKCVSKHLYINDADEKRKRVEVLVNIHSPMGHNFGTFASKPIKVISKPSKKRQSVKNMELCIHHGTTISLFNRIRSQTVSTKYLGVSMQNANQTFGPWYGNGNNMSSNPNDQPHPCFVARTGSWDPFIIWIVDPHYVKGKDDHSQHQPNSNFPRPPPAAIKSNSNNPIPIHYNQPIVLQCLTTGMTSPVMVIRKVDKGSMVIGGGILESLNGFGEGEEALGDPVSQLHKVAFQIKDVTITPTTSPTFQPSNQTHPPGPGTYLACLGDVVGMQRANEGRKIMSQPSTPTSSTSFLDLKISSPIPSPTSEIPPAVAVALAGTQTNFSFDSTPLSESAVVSTEGGKVIRKRRVSSSVVIRPTTTLSKSTLAKNRRRVNSLSGVASEVDLAKFASTARNSISGHRNNHDNAGALWTEDVTDAAVWTIVGTDCASYTFYSPQNMIARPSTSHHHHHHHHHHIISPLPPSTPVTPLPSISNIITATSSPSNSSSSQVQHSTTPNTITIYGENFTRDIMVWFGDIPSPRTEFRSKDCLVCWLPEELMYEIDHHNSIKRDIVNAGLQGRHLHLLPHGRMVGMNSGRPILFSRNDGVVFKTGKVWP